MKTSAIRKHEPTWYVIDAQGQILGRMATEIAGKLRGKAKPSFVPYLDCGDHVVVLNASNIVLTGNKAEDKAYHHYSGYPGGLKTDLVKDLIKRHPEKIVESAVKGMLPKNKLQNEWMKRLHVYSGSQHPHVANLANPALNA
jgi:large subunit ribosomal protein L13